MEDPVQTIVKCRAIKDEHSEVFKTVDSNERAAMALLKRDMMQKHELCRAVGDKHYYVIEKKLNKPPLTPETVGLLLQAYLTKMNSPWSEEQINNFVAFVNVSLVQLSTTEEKGRLTDKKPIKGFLHKLN